MAWPCITARRQHTWNGRWRWRRKKQKRDANSNMRQRKRFEKRSGGGVRKGVGCPHCFCPPTAGSPGATWSVPLRAAGGLRGPGPAAGLGRWRGRGAGGRRQAHRWPPPPPVGIVGGGGGGKRGLEVEVPLPLGRPSQPFTGIGIVGMRPLMGMATSAILRGPSLHALGQEGHALGLRKNAMPSQLHMSRIRGKMYGRQKMADNLSRKRHGHLF